MESAGAPFPSPIDTWVSNNGERETPALSHRLSSSGILEVLRMMVVRRRTGIDPIRSVSHHCSNPQNQPWPDTWLNQVEIWLNRITQRAIRRGTFRSVKDLATNIDQFVEKP
jgi:hypothetical protein